MASAVRIRGLKDLSTAFAHAEKDTRLGFRKLEREIAEPVRRDAEALATSSIRRIGRSWSRMRVGVTRTVVYVAPVERGVRVRGRDRRRRPNLAGLLMDRAMQPALDRNEATVQRAAEELLDRIGNAWEHD